MKRLLDDPSLEADVRRLLNSATEPRGPRPAELARMKSGLPSGGGGGGGGGLKLGLGAAGAGAAAMLLVLAPRLGDEPTLPPTVSPSSPSRPLVAAAKPTPVQAPPRQLILDGCPGLGLCRPASPPTSPEAPKRLRRARRGRRMRAQPPEAPPVAARPEPSAMEAVERPDELTLIERARATMGVEPEQALLALEQHLQHYPSGLLADERDFLAARVHAARGERAAVRGVQERLRARNPSSSYLSMIEKIIHRSE